MSNESVFKYGTQKTITTTGAATATNAVSAAAGTYAASDTAGYPDAEFALITQTWAGTPTANTTIDLYVRPLDIQSTNDQEAPAVPGSTTSWKGRYVCSFVMPGAGTGAIKLWAEGFNLPKDGEFYVYNNGTGQSLAVNWALYMTPRTYGPAA